MKKKQRIYNCIWLLISILLLTIVWMWMIVCVLNWMNEKKKVIDNNENGRVYLISVSFARADDLTTPYQDQIGIINTLGKPKCWC